MQVPSVEGVANFAMKVSARIDVNICELVRRVCLNETSQNEIRLKDMSLSY